MTQYFRLYPNGKVNIVAEVPPEIGQIAIERLASHAFTLAVNYDAEEFVRRLIEAGVPEEHARRCAATVSIDDSVWLDEVGARGG